MSIRYIRPKNGISAQSVDQLLSLGQNLAQGFSMDLTDTDVQQQPASDDEWTTDRLISLSKNLKNIWI